MTVNDTDERRVDDLLAPLADIPPVPYRERRPAPGRRWLRPALVGAACLAVVVAVGAAIVTAGSGTGSQPAATTPAPTPTPAVTAAPPPGTTGATPVPASPELGVWFLHEGGPGIRRVATPDPGTGPGVERRALEALLAGPPPGYTSAVAAGTTIEAFDVADTIATVRLSGARPTGVALRQIVETIVLAGDVHWVRFGDDPGLVDVEIASGVGDDAAPAIELVRAQYDGANVQFAGTADTFEANVQLRLMQGDRQLAHTFVTATCGTGCRGSFDGTLAVPAGLADQVAGSITTGTEPIRLQAYTLSAEDGSERDLVSTLVTAG